MARPFFETLRELSRCLEELGDAQVKIVAGVKATGRPGKLTLTIDYRAPKRGAVNYMALDYNVVAKIPSVETPESIFFPTHDNDLSKHDPHQRELPLASVDMGTGEIIEHAGAG
jgi:hypothetical protein